MKINKILRAWDHNQLHGEDPSREVEQLTLYEAKAKRSPDLSDDEPADVLWN